MNRNETLKTMAKINLTSEKISLVLDRNLFIIIEISFEKIKNSVSDEKGVDILLGGLKKKWSKSEYFMMFASLIDMITNTRSLRIFLLLKNDKEEQQNWVKCIDTVFHWISKKNKLENWATSIRKKINYEKKCQIQKIYVRDSKFSSEYAAVNLYPTKTAHWVTYINKIISIYMVARHENYYLLSSSKEMETVFFWV